MKMKGVASFLEVTTCIGDSFFVLETVDIVTSTVFFDVEPSN
jgi:hypothetical protein